MKKKLALISSIIAIIVILPLTYHLVHKHFITKSLVEKELIKESKIVKKVPHDFCLITYDISKNSGKTWSSIILQSGQVPTYKKQCWKKYTKLLSNFSDETDTDGNWYGKNKDGNLLSKPSMHFSPTSFTDNKVVASKAFTEFKTTA